MYRARIDSVSGTKVYADGKWLYCIGNKNHRVGDYVWTDGRCAYGHFQESQQPQVIIAPDDEGIPIVLASSPHLYTYKNKLKEIKEDIAITNAFHNMINDYRGRVYKVPWRIFGMPIHLQTHKIIASNITKSGDIYTIHVKIHKELPVFFAQIFKNEELLSTFDPQNYANAQKDYVISNIKSLVSQSGGGQLELDDLSTYPSYCFFDWGFIEDENNWAFMFHTECSILKNIKKYLGEGRRSFSYSHSPFSIYQSGFVEARSSTIYLTTNTGTTELFQIKKTYGQLIADKWMSPTGDVWEDPWITHIEPEYNFGDSQSVGLVSNPQIPLQDKYSYKIISSPIVPVDVPSASNTFLSPAINISLLDPQGNQIIEMKTYIFSYITIAKIENERYLIGIYSSFVPYDIDEKWNNYYKDFIEPGLYICENKDRNKTLTKLKSGNCLNHRLRSMKKIKGWHKRIKEIVLDLDEKEN